MPADPEPLQGIVYVATGQPSWASMCLASIASLRANGYADHVFVITDQADAPWPRDKTIVHAVPAQTSAYTSRHWKTQAGLLSPFTKNIYLDCDILAIGDLQRLWQEVKAEGIGFTVDIFPTLHLALAGAQCGIFSVPEQRATAEIATEDRPYYNGGVVCWTKNAGSDRFFSCWHEEWKRFSARDQFALARAFHALPATAYDLPGAFNFDAGHSATLAKAVHHKVNFVHFFGKGSKHVFYAFSRQIHAFRALDGRTQKKLEAVFKARIARDRDILKLLPLVFTLPPATGFRILIFIGLSMVSIFHVRWQTRVSRDRSDSDKRNGASFSLNVP